MPRTIPTAAYSLLGGTAIQQYLFGHSSPVRSTCDPVMRTSIMNSTRPRDQRICSQVLFASQLRPHQLEIPWVWQQRIHMCFVKVTRPAASKPTFHPTQLFTQLFIQPNFSSNPTFHPTQLLLAPRNYPHDATVTHKMSRCALHQCRSLHVRELDSLHFELFRRFVFVWFAVTLNTVIPKSDSVLVALEQLSLCQRTPH